MSFETVLPPSGPFGGHISQSDLQKRLLENNPNAIRPGVNLFNNTPQRIPITPEEATPGVRATLGAAYRQESDFASVSRLFERNIQRDSFEDDPNFQLDPQMLMNTPFEMRPDLVADVKSQQEFDFLHDWYRREIEDDQTVLAAGARGMGASMLMGLVSPLTLVSFGMGARTASLLKGFTKGTKAGLYGTALSETVLQAEQGFRPKEETVFAIAGGTFLMGIVGAAGGALGRSVMHRGVQDVHRIVGDDIERAVMDSEGTFFFRTRDVDAELERLQEAAIENREIITMDAVRAVFKEFGEEVDSAQISGRIDMNRALLVSTEDVSASARIIDGFKAIEEISLDSVSKAVDTASRNPITLAKTKLDDFLEPEVKAKPEGEAKPKVEAEKQSLKDTGGPEIEPTAEVTLSSKLGRSVEWLQSRTKNWREVSALTRELKALVSKKGKPDLPRRTMLERKLEELTSDKMRSDLRSVFKQAGLNPDDIDAAFDAVPTRKVSKGKVGRAQARADIETMIDERVNRLAQNDREVAHGRLCG